ncbi:MAG: MFS transporter [Cellulomonas sp.]|nr:MFS transporter [Cellulomonas sp.]
MVEPEAANGAGPTAPRSRAWVVWGAALAVYAAAVAQRTSFGVAGLEAAERFTVAATVLSLFAVVQVVVYALLQLPVGVALDRVGSRVMLTVGAATMAVGQLAMGLVDTVPLALVARVLIGAGDAMTFVSAIRLVPAWFPARRVPLLTQVTGIIGQLGQVVSAVPFVLALHQLGWTPAFAGLSALGLLAAVAAVVLVRDRPAEGPLVVWTPPPLMAGLGPTLRSAATWLGFWSHLVSAFSLHVFLLMWGYPFLVQGEGLSSAQAGGLFTLSVVVAIVSGPFIGELTGRYPARRSLMVLAVAVAILAGWLIVLIPTTPRPLWQLAVFVVLISLGGPTSLVGLDIAASFAPAERMGSATGVANAGGFIGAVVVMLAVGVVLDHRSGGAVAGLADYRAALWLVVALWVVGVVAVLVTRDLVRRTLVHPGDEAR